MIATSDGLQLKDQLGALTEQNQQLQEENQLLKFKLELLMDMVLPFLKALFFFSPFCDAFTRWIVGLTSCTIFHFCSKIMTTQLAVTKLDLLRLQDVQKNGA
jgi:hypothetical protein